MSASSGARSLILGRIRDALGARPPAASEYAGIAREYRQGPTIDAEARIALLVDRLLHYQVGVHRCGRDGLPGCIADVAALRGRTQLVVPPDLPDDWIPPSVARLNDAGLTYADLDRSPGVLTACSLAIAATGTIVLRHATGEGRRALTLVPDYHLCVVFAEQIVQTVPEALRRISAMHPTLVTTISGPSATADIEMTRIRGVHGPRTLDVVIVE
jgi:L-lactate dehydrogenase complex protein LldG